METTLLLDNKEYKALYKQGIVYKTYREYFGRDLLLDTTDVQQKFDARVKKNVNENKTEDAYYILLNEGGSLFYERLVWTGIKAYKTLHKEKFDSFDDFINNIEDYEMLISNGFLLLELITFGTKPIVEDDSKEEVVEEDTSKKKD